jgi:hypothetical protein
MTVAPPETLFGVSRALSRFEARSLLSFLSIVWKGQRGRPLADLENDLADLYRFFAPTATGRRLREAVATLPPVVGPRPASLSQEIFLASPGGGGLVTPEGRVTLHLLEMHRDQDPVAVLTDEVAWAYRIVADLYRTWGRERLLEALGIRESALRLPVVAFALTLLINGSIGKERALSIPLNEELEQELSGVLGPVIDAFVELLRPNRIRSESFRLRGGWTLSETTRHLFEFVAFTTSAIWIRRNRTKPLVERLARELARDKKRGSDDVAKAFEALARSYAHARPALASRGTVNERSAETQALKEQLLSNFKKARAVLD